MTKGSRWQKRLWAGRCRHSTTCSARVGVVLCFCCSSGSSTSRVLQCVRPQQMEGSVAADQVAVCWAVGERFRDFDIWRHLGGGSLFTRKSIGLPCHPDVTSDLCVLFSKLEHNGSGRRSWRRRCWSVSPPCENGKTPV